MSDPRSHAFSLFCQQLSEPLHLLVRREIDPLYHYRLYKLGEGLTDGTESREEVVAGGDAAVELLVDVRDAMAEDDGQDLFVQGQERRLLVYVGFNGAFGRRGTAFLVRVSSHAVRSGKGPSDETRAEGDR